jgi:hypothetical protein
MANINTVHYTGDVAAPISNIQDLINKETLLLSLSDTSVFVVLQAPSI